MPIVTNSRQKFFMQITSPRIFLKIQDYASAEAPSFQVFEIGPWLALATAGLGDPKQSLLPKFL
jgi:hypothetical protein